MPGEDAIGLGSLLKDTKPEDLDKFLSTFTKYERIFDKAMGMIEKLDKMGILPAAIRTAGVKAGIQDVDRPLKNPLGMVATSPTHYEFYRFLNKIPSDKIDEMHEGIKKAIENAKNENPKETEPEEALEV